MEKMSVLARDYGLRIISGGQIGADLAGLRAAQSVGLLTGGTAPKGYRTLKGPQPGLAGFGVVEHSRAGYPGRTLQNVIDADATVIVAKNINSAGTKLTVEYCEAQLRPHHMLHCMITNRGVALVQGPSVLDKAVDALAEQMKTKLANLPNEQFVINVAGNSTESAPGIFMGTYVLFLQLLNKLEAKLSNGDAVSQQFHERVTQMLQPHIPVQLEDVFEYIPQLDPRRAPLTLLHE
jgi:hypothetical protein